MSKINHTSGILLSGGRNSRMGMNKAFLEIDGIRLIDKILTIYRACFSDIIIVTNDPLSYLEFIDTTVVTDIYKGKGPLCGIYTGLFYASHPYAFVSACDMPHFNKDFVNYLISQKDNHDIIVPETHEGYQPLHAVYSRRCLPSMKRLLDLDKLKIIGFYRDMRVLAIHEEKIRPYNPDGRLFQNLNTPEDVAQVKILKSLS
ncbi:MAG: molybdenum cofactor guanylyltransferase [Syntrophaceae bacterium]|nr:molybdenum cofactor guanylyltransferase [Syntrophaceae bacterium]HOC58554.1 molybdenum cofactor guanylyltransferase [Smithellaceae bacterium]HQM46363.1 molybdenum cofactor guanylyltransferase [Smithellaceae bacterium]